MHLHIAHSLIENDNCWPQKDLLFQTFKERRHSSIVLLQLYHEDNDYGVYGLLNG